MCFARTVTQRNRYAARTAKKSSSKAAHGSDKTEQGGTLPPLAKLPRRAACVCACPRPPRPPASQQERSRGTPPARKATLATRGSYGFFWSSPHHPASNGASHTSRATCLRPQRSHEAFAAPSIFGSACARLGSRHIRAAVVAARSSYPRATLCADALVYRLQLQTPCVAKSSSAGDSSLANKGSPRATPRADPL